MGAVRQHSLLAMSLQRIEQEVAPSVSTDESVLKTLWVSASL